MDTFLNFTPDNSLQKTRYGIDNSSLKQYTLVQYYRYVTPDCATFDTGYAASGILKKFYFCNDSKLEYFASKLFRLDFFYINIYRHLSSLPSGLFVLILIYFIPIPCGITKSAYGHDVFPSLFR